MLWATDKQTSGGDLIGRAGRAEKKRGVTAQGTSSRSKITSNASLFFRFVFTSKEGL